MKKILVIFCSIFLSCNILAHDFSNKKYYITKRKSISNTPKVMEFFSFFCPYCYKLEKIHNIRSLIKKNVSTSANIEIYHVDFLGGKFSQTLTKSWIIAQQIGIEEKIILPIFKGIQETHTINNLDNIKTIFKESAGVDKKKFDVFWKSFTIEILVRKKNKEIKNAHLDYVPTMIINGKYIIDYSQVENSFKDNFSEKYSELIRFLINKK